MADADLNILVRAKGALQAARDIGKVDNSVSKLGRTAARGARTAAGNIAKIGVVAGAGIAIAARQGIESLAELEDATTSVDGAIAQMGLAGKVSSGQIATWANEIEASVDAAFDDKAIVSATATLIRFGKVAPQNIRPAMQIITDLATKTGDVDSAASLLAKALADPTKAAGKLARQGVVLTKEEQKQIAAFVKAGKVAEAQDVILKSLAKTTAGAAKASAGPYRDSLNVLTDVTEDAQRALGEGFLPVIEEVRGILQGELAKPSTVANIREFGKGLAGGLRSLVGIARNLPWGAIGDSLKVAGAGAKAVLDAFVGMPPWIQTAVLTGWGLNKLSGGALGSIVGELGKGLIKGALSMNAGVVNLKAGAVTGAGGVGGAAAGKGGGLVSGIAKVFLVGAAAGIAAELFGIRNQQSDENRAAGRALTGKTAEFVKVAGVPEMRASLAGILAVDRDLSTSTDLLNAQAVAFQLNLDGVRDSVRTQEDTLRAAIAKQEDGVTTSVETMKGSLKTSTDLAGTKTAAASLTGASQIVGAIHGIPAPIVNVNVSATTVNTTTTVSQRTGTQSGSRGNDQGGAFGGH